MAKDTHGYMDQEYALDKPKRNSKRRVEFIQSLLFGGVLDLGLLKNSMMKYERTFLE